MNKKSIRIFLAALLVIALAGSALAAVTTNVPKAKKEVKENHGIDPAKLSSLLEKNKDIQIIDVREASEYTAGHIPGAINIPRGLLDWFIAKKTKINKNDTFVVYCKTAGRSSLSALTLLDKGYKNVLSLNGGLRNWAKSGYAIETMTGTFKLEKWKGAVKLPTLK
jgi:rhodanese-related sulfurtransferase